MNEIFNYEFLAYGFSILSAILFLCLFIQKFQEYDLRSCIDEYKSKIEKYRINEYKNEREEYRKKWSESNKEYCNMVATARDDLKKLGDIIDNYKKENSYLESTNRYLSEELERYRDQETEVNDEED